MQATFYRLTVVALVAALIGIGFGRVTSVRAAASQDTVYVATGENFPDALGVASVAALTNAPVLFVLKDSIPAVTTGELNRLHPANIVIVGGTGVVSDTVKTTLEGLSFHPTVTRLAGVNRYATAVEVSKSRFPAPLDADTLQGKTAAELQTGAWSVWHDGALAVTGGSLASKLQLTGLPAGSYVIRDHRQDELERPVLDEIRRMQTRRRERLRRLQLRGVARWRRHRDRDRRAHVLFERLDRRRPVPSHGLGNRRPVQHEDHRHRGGHARQHGRLSAGGGRRGHLRLRRRGRPAKIPGRHEPLRCGQTPRQQSEKRRSRRRRVGVPRGAPWRGHGAFPAPTSRISAA